MGVVIEHTFCHRRNVVQQLADKLTLQYVSLTLLYGHTHLQTPLVVDSKSGSDRVKVALT